MAGKEALAFVIDVRQPMGTLTGDDATSGSTRLSAAVRGVEAMVTAKMMQSKQTEAIIVLAGTDGTDNHLNQKEVEEGVDDAGYQNVSTIGIFERPTIRTLRALRDVSEPGGVTNMGVLISGLIVAYDALDKRVGKLKFVKRRARAAAAARASLARARALGLALIVSPPPPPGFHPCSVFLVTDASGELSEDDIEDLQSQIQGMIQSETCLQVIGCDFAASGDEGGDIDVRRENQRMLAEASSATPRGAVREPPSPRTLFSHSMLGARALRRRSS